MDIFTIILQCPSARNNTLASIKQETNLIDQIVVAYKGKELAPEEKKLISDFEARLDRDAAGLPGSDQQYTGQ